MVTVADDPADSSVAVTLDVASVRSGDQTRDDHLCSGDLLDVEHHPTATFHSTQVTWDGSHGTVTRDLTINDVTRPVTLEAEFVGHAHDPWGNDRAIVSARTTINREDWGLTWNMPVEAGDLLVSREIRLEIDIETIRQP